MDDGYVIPRLNEDWTFAGATVMEWSSGLVSGMMFHELFTDGKANSMPIVILVMVGIPVLLAGIRKTFPDEERGMRNALMVSMGVNPPDLPICSKLQPVWSGMPLREMDKELEFITLGLDKLFEEGTVLLEEDNPDI